MDRQSDLTFNFAGAAVVMIDASMMSLDVMTSILSGYGFKRMHRCATLSAGLDILKTHRVDLVLIDPACFGEEGYGTIRWLRSEAHNPNCETSVLITTVLTDIRTITTS
jgi:DNA-binding NarL/FixJ family response regulator